MMEPNVNPELAADLSKVGRGGAVDLSGEAIEAREREASLHRAGRRARLMSRAFKGILGQTGRRRHIENALRHEGLID